MIVVVTGTHHQPFDRLVRAAAALATAFPDEPVRVQRGVSRVVPPGCEVAGQVPPEVLTSWLRDARVVVTHAGTSLFLEARSLGRRPILVPRRPEHGEHVDDHQVRFARSISATEAAVAEPAQLVAAVRGHWEPPRPADLDPDARSRAFAERLAALVDGLFDGDPRGRR